MSEIPIPHSIEILKTIEESFLKELKESSRGKRNSIAFIKHSLPGKPLVGSNVGYQVINIGGSFFEKAMVKSMGKKIRISNYEKGKVPIFETKQIFLSFFEKHLSSKTNIVCVNFAYHLKPILRNNILYGRIVQGTKEHRFIGLIGQVVGDQLEDLIFRKQGRKITITVANDTVCLILAGIQIAKRQEIVGGIVGTGTNFGFFQDDKTIINLESGNFDKFAQTEMCAEIDKLSQSPRRHLFEKEISGAYLYRHYNILGEKIYPHIRSIPDTREISVLAAKNKGIESGLAKKIIEHSASLIACEIAAIYLYKRRKRLIFLMEGTLFWKGCEYKKKVSEYLRKLNIKKGSIEFVKLSHSNLVGGARLALVSSS